MGPAPEKPIRIWGAPVAGVPNPQFPTLGPPEPTGNYRTQINDYRVGNPINAGMQREITKVPQAFKSDSTSAGDRTRDAFSRSVADTSRNALARGTDTYNVAYKTQAQKAVSEDINAQRQSMFDRHRMNVMKLIFDEDTAKRFESSINDISAYYERERKNSEAMVTAAMLRMFGGILGGLL